MSNFAQPIMDNQPPKAGQTPTPKSDWLHKVCIQCNGMFRVPPDKFDAKQCPNCHKG